MKIVATAALLALTAADADAATYAFSFRGLFADSGIVEGRIVLPDGDGDVTATSVLIETFPAALGLGDGPIEAITGMGPPEEAFPLPPVNGFTVSGGEIVDLEFRSYLGPRAQFGLASSPGCSPDGVCLLERNYLLGPDGAVEDVFASTLAISSVPLPASLPLVLAGLGGLALACRRG